MSTPTQLESRQTNINEWNLYIALSTVARRWTRDGTPCIFKHYKDVHTYDIPMYNSEGLTRIFSGHNFPTSRWKDHDSLISKLFAVFEISFTKIHYRCFELVYANEFISHKRWNVTNLS